MHVQITLNVPKLKSTKAALDFANSLIEHLADTFNDDCSIKEFTIRVPKKGGQE